MITGSLTEPRRNGAKITKLLTEERGSANLFRTCHAGPSGQRMALCVGRIIYQPFGPDDFWIYDPETGDHAGYARRALYEGEWWWSITETLYDGGLRWIGYFDSLATGLDVLFRGRHAALGRHDSTRLSPGRYHLAEEFRRVAERAKPVHRSQAGIGAGVMTPYFQRGDQARYHGAAQGDSENLVIAGDLVTVHEGNFDEDDVVWVSREGCTPVPVSAEHLEWLGGRS